MDEDEIAEEGRALYAEGKYSAALLKFQAALAIKKNHVLSLNGMGYVYLGMKKFDEALRAFEQVLEVQPDNFQAIAGKMHTYFKKGQFTLATISASVILHKPKPKRMTDDLFVYFKTEANFLRGQAFLFRGKPTPDSKPNNPHDYEKAIKYLQVEEKDSESKHYCYLGFAVLFLRGKDFIELSRIQFNKCIQTSVMEDDINIRSFRQLASLGLHILQYSEEKSDEEKLFSKYDPETKDQKAELSYTDQECFLLLGIYFRTRQNFPKALLCFERIIKSNPESRHAKFNLIVTYRRMGKISFSNNEDGCALMYFEKALSIINPIPNLFGRNMKMGRICFSENKYGYALEYFEKAWTINPNSKKAQNWRRKALEKMGDVFVLAKQFDQASLVFLRALAINPNSKTTGDSFASCYDRLINTRLVLEHKDSKSSERKVDDNIPITPSIFLHPFLNQAGLKNLNDRLRSSTSTDETAQISPSPEIKITPNLPNQVPEDDIHTGTSPTASPQTSNTPSPNVRRSENPRADSPSDLDRLPPRADVTENYDVENSVDPKKNKCCVML